MSKQKHTIKGRDIGGWTGFRYGSETGRTVEGATRTGSHVLVTLVGPLDSGTPPSTVKIAADDDVDVFGPQAAPDVSLTDKQRSLLATFADHPMLWDAADLFAIVCELQDAGYVSFIGDGPLAQITEAGRELLKS